MKQVLIKKGQAVVEEIPAPQIEKNKILVQVHHSCISIGTEMSGVKQSGIPLWEKALKQPDKVKKVLQMVATQGISKTRNLVKGKLAAGVPSGYSASGVVIGLGKDIKDIKIGDKVACAGAQCAHHAEVINVLRNLTVKIPQGVTMQEASTVTLGAIAMQGVRRAMPTLGEIFVVIGLGVIGQIVVQLLKANGCRVIVSDLDRARIERAIVNGADIGVHPDDGVDIERVMQITGGIGADGVIITAATKSDAVVSTAFQMCRRKGRVVLVGDVGLHLKRSDFYEKEIDFFISTSYGPGRYDQTYEENGLEYPVAYVRWTENRNMEEVLRLVAEKKLKVGDMVDAVYPLADATDAYESLKNTEQKPLMVLLAYPPKADSNDENAVVLGTGKALAKDKLNIAVAGAGGFAKGMHLPNIAELQDLYHLSAVMSRTGHNAANTAKQFQADYATTDYAKLLQDENIDLVFITTRHNLHAGMVLEALSAGKHVLVEKPLAIDQEELNRIKDFYRAQENAPMLLTGFNRRHSKYMQAIREVTEKRLHPMIINYKMNAGYIPLDHWVHTEEGAGRNIGEACHIYDVFNFLTNAKVEKVVASSMNPTNAYYSAKDNFITTITYQDGSVANLIYTAAGAKEYPKETMELFFDGKTIVLDDYKRLTSFGVKINLVETKISEKGQKEEIEALAEALMQSGKCPIPFWQQVQAMEIAFAVEKQL